MNLCLSAAVLVAVVIAIAAAVYVIGKRKTVARDEYRFHSARTIEHELIVSDLRRGGVL